MNKQKHILNTITKRILIGLGVVVVSAVITVALVKLFYSPSVTKVTTSTTSPSDLIKKYTDGYKLDGYTMNKSMSDSIISYKLSDTTYTVQISALDNVQFTKPDNSTVGDITTATDNSKKYLTDNGLSRVSDQIYADQAQLLYDNQNTVCKISNSFDPTKKTSSYGLVCVDKKVIVTERDAIQSLLTLYTKTGGVTDFKNIVRTTLTESNKTLSLLFISPQDKAKEPYTLIFASIDSKWSYIGSRVTPSIDVQESFQISDTLKKAINDPKYGGFLAKYIY